ncbi:hypothetical protein AB6D11_02525 [Vibrio splendidus]
MKTVHIVSHDCITTCGYAWHTNAVQAYEAYLEERRSLFPSLWTSQCSLHSIITPKSLNQEAITDYINEHALSLPKSFTSGPA